MNDNDYEVTRKEPSARRGPGALGLLAFSGIAAAGGWVAYSATMIDHNLPLPLPIDSERHLFNSGRAGLLNYYTDENGQGRPLVLIHSVNAAASSYEMRPLFEHYRQRRPVYALDLPGFGFSERSDRYYSPGLYAGAIGDFLDEVVEEPADVIALSLGAEFAARAALDDPGQFNSLVLISPTGLSEVNQKGQSPGAAERDRSADLLKLFTFPLWSQALYDLLVTKPSLSYFLNRSFQGPVDEGMLSYAYLTGHQPGARFAPLHFISGGLFTPRVATEIYARLELPALVIYDQDAYTGFAGLPDLLLPHPNWGAVRVTPTRGLPHFEQLETTARVLDNFWQSAKPQGAA